MVKKLGALSWEEPGAKESTLVPDFKKFCQEKYSQEYPQKDNLKLEEDIHSFSVATREIATHFDQFYTKIARLPLLSVLLYWCETITKDKTLSQKNAKAMQDLLEAGFIGVTNTKGEAWTLQSMVAVGHNVVIEAIRCHDAWSIQKTEEYVELYISFVNWLSEITFGYVPKAIDPDVEKTKQRKISHKQFVAICSGLKVRERLIAKMMYFGGTRTLEEILEVKISDIDVQLKKIAIGGENVCYPKHVFKDIFEYVLERKKGYLFLGSYAAEKLDGTVPYRALKAACSKMNLGSTFSFKHFLKNF